MLYLIFTGRVSCKGEIRDEGKVLLMVAEDKVTSRRASKLIV
jgi:hypothetical protein